MRPKGADPARLWDVQVHARAIRDVTSSLNLEQHLANENLRYAMDRRLEIMGEAVKRILIAFRKAHPEIPWAGIAGLRDVLAHQYEDIGYEKVWRVIAQGIPDLIAKLEPLVPPPPPDPEPNR